MASRLGTLVQFPVVVAHALPSNWEAYSVSAATVEASSILGSSTAVGTSVVFAGLTVRRVWQFAFRFGLTGPYTQSRPAARVRQQAHAMRCSKCLDSDSSVAVPCLVGSTRRRMVSPAGSRARCQTDGRPAVVPARPGLRPGAPARPGPVRPPPQAPAGRPAPARPAAGRRPAVIISIPVSRRSARAALPGRPPPPHRRRGPGAGAQGRGLPRPRAPGPPGPGGRTGQGAPAGPARGPWPGDSQPSACPGRHVARPGGGRLHSWRRAAVAGQARAGTAGGRARARWLAVAGRPGHVRLAGRPGPPLGRATGPGPHTRAPWRRRRRLRVPSPWRPWRPRSAPGPSPHSRRRLRALRK